MNCMFLGHRDAGGEAKETVKTAILDLIEKEKIDAFLVGNNGNFDFYVQCVLQEMKEAGADIRFCIVLSYLGEKALSGNQSETVFPEGLENTIPKYAISKRNEWMIKNASYLIAYVKHNFSHTKKWIDKAKKRGLTVIDLADM